MRLLGGAGVRHGALLGVADGLGIAPDRARLVFVLARLPALAALGELGVAQGDVDGALIGVDGDDVAVADQRDRAADSRLGPDMADAEAARRAREAAVGDERDLAAGALAVERRRRRQHLAHAGTAARPLVADDEDVPLLVLPLLDAGEALFLAVEAARRTREAQLAHAGDLDDGALRRK